MLSRSAKVKQWYFSQSASVKFHWARKAAGGMPESLVTREFDVARAPAAKARSVRECIVGKKSGSDCMSESEQTWITTCDVSTAGDIEGATLYIVTPSRASSQEYNSIIIILDC
jgi:hypothetical protein